MEPNLRTSDFSQPVRFMDGQVYAQGQASLGAEDLALCTSWESSWASVLHLPGSFALPLSPGLCSGCSLRQEHPFPRLLLYLLLSPLDALGQAKMQCSWRHHLLGLLVQILLALCFFSYLHVSQDKPIWPPKSRATAAESLSAAPSGSSQGNPCQATPEPPARPPLLLLLWTWPFNIPVALSRCSELWPGTPDCQLTVNRSAYPRADAVLVHHREISSRPRAQLPPSPRPPGQRWVWFNMEPPDHCLNLKALDGFFNLTISYRRDSDIFVPYGWLEPWPGQPEDPPPPVNLSAKTELVAWVVSNWRTESARVRYYEMLREHLKVDVFGRSHTPLPWGEMMGRLARYKFYLAFENSLHPDYITEKLWKNALLARAVPVVLGPSRSNYEQFLPADAFIHVDDFQSPRELAQYLLALDRDPARYLSYFRWRETLRPRSFSWALMFCRACWRLQQEAGYRTVPSIASWFT
ncbi:3-galactosyl-N-acetylglucosaminide 4-alpha-L-fucosyltransferase FUT3-like [Diceros bicornis minor]|uniref:3-galactosyl-N-acetylglucosaminide 4-alpha-L-fucosyltransferase FUT3-like n=1 Tax=Diceros bicornis minor TaxID=77932 RepID=UPI0026F2C2C0|nr:3-galactosyl-N-acetylglucosaminide 4-alpha-L-fucosyltransferase FUT3-like [Diceros bicornis minor]